MLGFGFRGHGDIIVSTGDIIGALRSDGGGGNLSGGVTLEVFSLPSRVLVIVELDKASSAALPSVIQELNVGAGRYMGGATELRQGPSLHNNRVFEGDGLIKVGVYHAGHLITGGVA